MAEKNLDCSVAQTEEDATNWRLAAESFHAVGLHRFRGDYNRATVDLGRFSLVRLSAK